MSAALVDPVEPEPEFVDRVKAAKEAARFVSLLTSSNEAKVEAWFAMQAVADLVGPASNVGVKGIHWYRPRGSTGLYGLQAQCVDGEFKTSTGGPGTLKEAREPKHLDVRIALFEKKIRELGGRSSAGIRPKGTTAALIAAVEASSGGKEWTAARKSASHILGRMVNVADAYGRDGVYPEASLAAHLSFIGFDNRAELIRAYPGRHEAAAKAMSLHRGEAKAAPRHTPSRAQVVRMVLKTGAPQGVCRELLRARMEGSSKAKALRAVNEAWRDA